MFLWKDLLVVGDIFRIHNCPIKANTTMTLTTLLSTFLVARQQQKITFLSHFTY